MTSPDLGALLFEQANALNERFRAGLDAGRDAERRAIQSALRLLFTAYDQANEDPQTRMPTTLHALIERLRTDYGQ